MFEKIWSRHVVAEGPGGHVLLYIDRHLLHEGSTPAFGRLTKAGRRLRRPDLSFATADHYVLTSPGAFATDPEIVDIVESLARAHQNCRGHWRVLQLRQAGYLTVSEVAKTLGIGTTTLRRRG